MGLSIFDLPSEYSILCRKLRTSSKFIHYSPRKKTVERISSIFGFGFGNRIICVRIEGRLPAYVMLAKGICLGIEACRWCQSYPTMVSGLLIFSRSQISVSGLEFAQTFFYMVYCLSKYVLRTVLAPVHRFEVF